MEEYSLRIAPTTSRRHSIFQHLNVINIKHHRFLITSVTHLLLFKETIKLVNRVVQLRESIAQFRTSDHRLKTLHRLWIFRISL
jgi:hypothetical protein